jgi:hypothetical protein
MRGGTRQTRQHKQGTFYTSSSSVGTLKPAQKLLPLDLASTPTDARDNQKSPLNNPTMSSRMKRFNFFLVTALWDTYYVYKLYGVFCLCALGLTGNNVPYFGTKEPSKESHRLQAIVSQERA